MVGYLASVDGSTGGEDDGEGAGSEGCYMESSEEESSSGVRTPKGQEVFARVGAYSAARERTKLMSSNVPTLSQVQTPSASSVHNGTALPVPAPSASPSPCCPTPSPSTVPAVATTVSNYASSGNTNVVSLMRGE